jgi:transcriptional repressor NrdR
MHCPFCKAPDSRVIDSRLTDAGEKIRRRRKCFVCMERFNTLESVEISWPRVVKRDSSRVPFQEEKLRAGIERALQKRPISVDQLDALMRRLLTKLKVWNEREVASQLLGEWVMDELRHLDPVAYVRFASVYRCFQDVQAFKQEVEILKKHDESLPGKD